MWAFLPSPKAFSLECLECNLGELAAVQLAEQRDDVVDVLGAGASLRDALSAWRPSTSNGNKSSNAMYRSEMAGTAPTCSSSGPLEGWRRVAAPTGWHYLSPARAPALGKFIAR